MHKNRHTRLQELDRWPGIRHKLLCVKEITDPCSQDERGSCNHLPPIEGPKLGKGRVEEAVTRSATSPGQSSHLRPKMESYYIETFCCGHCPRQVSFTPTFCCGICPVDRSQSSESQLSADSPSIMENQNIVPISSVPSSAMPQIRAPRTSKAAYARPKQGERRSSRLVGARAWKPFRDSPYPEQNHQYRVDLGQRSTASQLLLPKFTAMMITAQTSALSLKQIAASIPALEILDPCKARSCLRQKVCCSLLTFSMQIRICHLRHTMPWHMKLFDDYKIDLYRPLETSVTCTPSS